MHSVRAYSLTSGRSTRCLSCAGRASSQTRTALAERGPGELFSGDFEGHGVRVLGTPDKPWFVAKDVCDVLGIANSRDAMKALDDDEKSSVALTDGTDGNPNFTVISEPGLYRLIFKSRKPAAKKFCKWVVSEVLPSIRKTGRYESRPRLTEMDRVTPQDVMLLCQQLMLQGERQIEAALQHQKNMTKAVMALATIIPQTGGLIEQRSQPRELFPL